MPGLLQAWGMCWLCQRTRWSPQTAPKATVNPASKWQAVAATGALAYLNWRNIAISPLTLKPLVKSRHFNNPNRFICEVRPGARAFFRWTRFKVSMQSYSSNLDSCPSNLYHQNDDVSFSHLLPVLYLLLYACVHWRREAADLRIF
jgi:hypothetical protein